MSHSEVLSRLTVGYMRSDLIRRALRSTIDRLQREWNDTVGLSRTIGRSQRTAWLVSQISLLLCTALIGGVGLSASAAAQVTEQPPAVSPYILTPKRIAASVAGVTGLIGAVIGGLALVRSTRRIGTGNGRRGAIVALVLAPIGLIIGGLVVATADGGLGTGNGFGGGIVAMLVGLIGMALGGLALARSRRVV